MQEVHAEYVRAGAEILETNTFGATSIVLAEYGLDRDARELNRIAAELARAEAERFSSARQRFVAGSMGPTTKSISVTGGVTFVQLSAAYQEQAEGLLEGGADILL